MVWTEAGQNNNDDMTGAGEVSVSTETRVGALISPREQGKRFRGSQRIAWRGLQLGGGSGDDGVATVTAGV